MASVSANRIHNIDRRFRESKQGMLDWVRFCSFTPMHAVKTRKKAVEKSNPMEATITVIKDLPILPRSRDGTLCKYWANNFCCDLADRRETPIDPMAGFEIPCEMMQIFSLKLAETHINSGSIELYGYIAARDEADYMLNYVFNRSRDDPITVQQGSLIEMTGPKRGIALSCDVLLEIDMRIKNGNKEEDDLQLIDGVSEFLGLHMPSIPRKVRIEGNCGAVDMSYACVLNAVGAVVEVFISYVESDFDLTLSSIISMVEQYEVHEEFQLFHGTVTKSCGLRRFVIAVTLDTVLRFKVKIDHKCSNSNEEDDCSFVAKLNGYASHQINLEAAAILVKVTWAAVPT